MTNNVKVCSVCSKIKPTSDFYRDKYRKDGFDCMCKKCKEERTLKFKRTKFGLIGTTYYAQIHRSKRRNMPCVSYTKNELRDWFMNQKNFNELYNNWVDSGYKTELRPSVDRLDDYKGYSFDNIRLVTLKENINKSYLDRKNGTNSKNFKPVIKCNLKGEKLEEYCSAPMASRENNISLTEIYSALKKTAGGYVWEYVNE